MRNAEPTDTTTALLDQALVAKEPAARRQAFVALVRSDDWRQVLAPHVISRQGYKLGDAVQPDWITFREAARHIAAREDQIQRCLEMAGNRFSDELLLALAREKGAELVDHALPHLRTADGPRAQALQFILNEADPTWVTRALARSVIRRHLKQTELDRSQMIGWLAQAGNFGEFLENVEQNPPMAIEEWNALGLAGVYSEELFNRAMAILPHHPGPILYLVRLDPLPDEVSPRVMASARAEWVSAALELLVVHGVAHPILAPLAELGVRLGGRCLSAANVWIGSTKLSRELLRRMAAAMKTAEDGRVNELLWIRRQAPSADRALERGRSDQEVDPMDAAALVRQLRGDKVPELVFEILDQPRERMTPALLRLLCAVHREAAQQVANLCHSPQPDVAKRAREARGWPDVLWPEEEEEGD